MIHHIDLFILIQVEKVIRYGIAKAKTELYGRKQHQLLEKVISGMDTIAHVFYIATVSFIVSMVLSHRTMSGISQ